jgi:hypothetical protein
MGVLRKKFKHTLIQKYFCLPILINVKAGRVKKGAALDSPAVAVLSAKCGSLDVSEPCGLSRPVTGIAYLLLPLVPQP